MIIKWWFCLFLHKNLCCECSLESPCRGDSNEHPQHRFLWRFDKNYLWIIIKYHQIRTLFLLLWNIMCCDIFVISHLKQQYCKSTYFRGYLVSCFTLYRHFCGDLFLGIALSWESRVNKSLTKINWFTDIVLTQRRSTSFKIGNSRIPPTVRIFIT